MDAARRGLEDQMLKMDIRKLSKSSNKEEWPCYQTAVRLGGGLCAEPRRRKVFRLCRCRESGKIVVWSLCEETNTELRNSTLFRLHGRKLTFCKAVTGILA